MCKSFGKPAPAQYLSLLVFPTRLFNQFDKLCKIFLPFSQTSKAALLENWNKYLITKNILADFFSDSLLGTGAPNQFVHNKQLKALHATHETKHNSMQLTHLMQQTQQTHATFAFLTQWLCNSSNSHSSCHGKPMSIGNVWLCNIKHLQRICVAHDAVLFVSIMMLYCADHAAAKL